MWNSQSVQVQEGKEASSNVCREKSRRGRISVMCSHQASNYKIQVTTSVFSGLSLCVSVRCPRVCMAETSHIPILFDHWQKNTLTQRAHTMYEALEPNCQCNSSFSCFCPNQQQKLYSPLLRVPHISIHIEYIKMQKSKNIKSKWKHLRYNWKIKKKIPIIF